MKSIADNSMLEGTKIDELGMKEQVDLLNTIDKLRDLGISDHVGLPQLIVCGDQSSGKSSVLEAITRLRFPTGSDVCTMFATELTLRRATSNHVNVSIKPGSARSESQKKRLSEFNEHLTTPEKFPDIIDAAKEHMRNVSQESVHSFFNDILRIEITGPDVLQLTIVDLPGLIHVPDEEKSNDDAVVQDLVESYMANKRSIILAVISASANMSLQKVIGLMRQHDPDRARTLGIITKLDTLDDGSEVQQKYLKLAKNQDIVLKHRWHALRNRDFPSRDRSAKERDDVERAFFDSAIWKPLHRADVGIDALRRKLSAVLLQQIRCELPSLIVGISSQIDECKSELHQLGEPRPDIGDQKIYLSSICEAYQKIATFAVSGLYEFDPFFRDSSPDDKSRKNLRASLQLFNEQFSDVMYNKGHSWELPNYEQQTAAPGYSNPLDEMVAQPPKYTTQKFVEDMHDTMLLERRCEPIGMIHPSHIGALLQNHSKPWKGIAEKHLCRTWEAVKVFLESVISHLTDTTTCAALMAEKIYPMLDEKWDELTTKLEELLFPTQCHPLTYAPEYIDFARPKPNVNSENNVEGILADQTGSAQNVHQVYWSGDQNYNYLYKVMIKQYNTIRSHFIDNVACLAIEKCLISSLPRMLSAEDILRMDDESVRRLASESTEISDKRDSLQQTLDVLTRGLNTIRRQASLEPEAMRILRSSPHQNAVPSNATQPLSVSATTQRTPSTLFNGSRNDARTNSASRQNGNGTGAPPAFFGNSSFQTSHPHSSNATPSKAMFNNPNIADFADDEL